MKKGHNHSIRASALQIATCLVLLVVSAIIFASSFRAAPQAADSQPGFYPPLPVKVDPGQDQDPNAPTGLPGITISLPIDTIDTSVTTTTPTVPAGLTANNWNVSGNVIGTGQFRILRVSAFSNDFTPLDGSGLLYNLRMLRVSNTPGASSALNWQPAPDNFQFIDGDLNTFTPTQTNGLITITGATPTATATATAGATATATATATFTPTATATATATA